MRIINQTIAGIAICTEILSGTALRSNEQCSDNGGTSLADPDAALALADWIGTRTGWKLEKLPRICLISEHGLSTIASSRDRWSNLTLRSLYSSRTRTIFLPNTWDSFSIRHRSYLLHEMVHHLQAVNKIDAPCLAALEAKAFDLQLQWLREQGVRDPYGFIGTNAFTVMLLSQCSD